MKKKKKKNKKRIYKLKKKNKKLNKKKISAIYAAWTANEVPTRKDKFNYVIHRRSIYFDLYLHLLPISYHPKYNPLDKITCV